MFKKENTIY